MKDKIISCAFGLFVRQGIKSTSMHGVALACSIPVKELTHSFNNKEVLVSAIVNQLLEKNNKYLTVNPGLSPNAITEIDNFFQFTEDQLAHIGPSFLREVRKYYHPVWKKLTDFKEIKLIPYINTNIKRGISEGSYRTDIQQQDFGRIYFLILKSALEDSELRTLDTRKLIHQLHNILMHGVLNMKGKRWIDREI